MVTSLVVVSVLLAAESAAIFFIVRHFGFREVIKAFGIAIS